MTDLTSLTQMNMPKVGLILASRPHFTDQCKQLKEHVHEFMDNAQNAESTIDSKLNGEAEVDTNMHPKRLVEGQDGMDLDTKQQTLLNTHQHKCLLMPNIS